MTFEAFVEIYITDKKKRLRENTWSVKEHIIRTKILPYFKEKRLSRHFTKTVANHSAVPFPYLR